jgi:hypothetical protein
LAIAICRHRPRRTLEPYIAAFRVDDRRSEGVDKTDSTPTSQAIAMSRHRPRRTLEPYIAAFRAAGGPTGGIDKRSPAKKGFKT